MKIYYYEFASLINDKSAVMKQNNDFIESIGKKLNTKLIKTDKPSDEDSNLTLIFIESGGVEGQFINQYQQFKEPYLLLTTSINNSLAASMEILSFLKQHNLNGEILHGDIDNIANKILLEYQINEAHKTLNNSNLGVIGKPSDWLIASNVDYKKAKELYGINLIDLSIDELVNKYNNVKKLSFNDEYSLSYNLNDLNKSKQVYQALLDLKDEYNLSGLTIRCFDLLTRIKATSCLALGLLNANNITATCEGDVASMLSMHILYALTNKEGFQANPSKIDINNKEIIFAHCTIPFNMLEDYYLDSHFESGIGVAIKGKLKLTDCTVFKLSNDLSSFFVEEGQIIQNLDRSDLCRTQIVVKMDNLDYFLKNPYGNHHIIIPGRYKNLINRFFNK